MTTCLGERALWRLQQGEGTAAEWAHVAGCVLCGGRQRDLARDLALIGRALEGAEPVPAPRPAWWRTPRLVPATVTAVAVGVALVGGAMWGQLQGLPAAAPAREEAVGFLEEVSVALFSTPTSVEGEGNGTDPGLAELQAALDGQAPDVAQTRRTGS